MAALREKLIAEGIDASALDRIKAPAGLDLGAITPEEIAMSILAEMTWSGGGGSAERQSNSRHCQEPTVPPLAAPLITRDEAIILRRRSNPCFAAGVSGLQSGWLGLPARLVVAIGTYQYWACTAAQYRDPRQTRRRLEPAHSQ
jgi:hypothetical protein